MKQVWGQLPDQVELTLRMSALEKRVAAMLVEFADMRASLEAIPASVDDAELHEQVAALVRG
jgi:hypothetical protein